MSDQFKLEQIDGRNITYALAQGIGRVRVIAMSEDIVQQSIYSDDERIDSKVIPHYAEVEKLQAKLKLIERKTTHATRWVYLSMMIDPRLRAYALVDKNSGSIVACAEWVLPSYIEAPFKVSLVRKLYVSCLAVWYGFLDRLHPAPSIYPILDVYHRAASQVGIHVDDADQQIEILKQKSPKELSYEVYPEDLTYYLRIFGVRTDYHGKGLGKILLNASMDSLRKEAIKPPMIDGPAKFLWQAAPLAADFYRKMGCSEGPTATVDGLDHTAFFVNID